MTRSSLALCVVATLGLGCNHRADVVASLSTQQSEPAQEPAAGSSASEPIAGMGGPLGGAAAPMAGSKAPTAMPPPTAGMGGSAPQAGSASDPCDRLWPDITYYTLLNSTMNECKFKAIELGTFADFFSVVPVGPPQPETSGPTECTQGQIEGPFYAMRDDPENLYLCENACKLLVLVVKAETDRRMTCAEAAD